MKKEIAIVALSAMATLEAARPHLGKIVGVGLGILTLRHDRLLEYQCGCQVAAGGGQVPAKMSLGR